MVAAADTQMQDALLQVFQHLPVGDHRDTLPLVCRSWARLLRSGSPGIWRELEINFASECGHLPFSVGKPTVQVVGHAVEQWVQPRGAGVRDLALRDSQLQSAGGLAVTLHNFDRYTVARLLGHTQRLQRLVVDRCSDLLSPETLRAAAALPGLQILELRGVQRQLTASHASELARFRGLRRLVIGCDHAQGTAHVGGAAAAEVVAAPPADGFGGTAQSGGAGQHWGLDALPAAVLAHNAGLTSLELSGHRHLTALPDEISCLTRLQELSVIDCALRQLPPSLGSLAALTRLDLEGNAVLGSERSWDDARDAIPESLASGLAGSLRCLSLARCGLRALPGAVTRLTSLSCLDVDGNPLGGGGWGPGLPPGLSALSCLEHLHAADCGLGRVPDDAIRGLTGLVTLDLAGNGIGDAGVPGALSRLQRLGSIGLKRNALTRVPRVLGALPALREIFMEDNEYLEVPEPLDFIADLPRLELFLVGKGAGATWAAASVHHLAQLFGAVARRHPHKRIVRITYPDARAPPPVSAGAAAGAGMGGQMHAAAAAADHDAVNSGDHAASGGGAGAIAPGST